MQVRGPGGVLAALTLARIAFGYQFQNVASLGPLLARQFHMDFALLGALVGLYMAPGVVLALPAGFAARRFGDRTMVAAGLLLMVAGSALCALATGPAGIGAGRVIAGAGAVALTVLQGKIAADHFDGHRFTLAMGLIVGAFPVGVGLAQLVQVPLALAFGIPAAFAGGTVLAGFSLLLLLVCWAGGGHVRAPLVAWPTRQETLLVLLAGLIWTSYNAGYANFLAYLPSTLIARGHPRWIDDVVLTLSTWGNLPAILFGSAVAARFGPSAVFVFGSTVLSLSIAGMGLTDWPLLWGALFGTLGAVQAGLIMRIGTLSARPANRAVGMGMFYTLYYIGGASLPALCGRAADAMGDPSGAFLAAGALSALALPAYWAHRHFSRAAAPT
jgi:predicted MFS family arabinose efflux permease